MGKVTKGIHWEAMTSSVYRAQEGAQAHVQKAQLLPHLFRDLLKNQDNINNHKHFSPLEKILSNLF
jgi:hypothetical protein